MEDYVSTEVYALRHFSASDGQARDHWGFAWSPHNQTGMSSADFAAGTGAILDRLAAAIHDSDEAGAADPGLAACGAGAAWCRGDAPGSWSNDAWRTFSYWGRLGLTFEPTGHALPAGGVLGPLVAHTELAGAARSTPSALTVTFATSSGQGGFSTSPTGPFSEPLALTIPAGSGSTPPVYYSDTTVGSPTITATALGTTGASTTVTVVGGRTARRASDDVIGLWHTVKRLLGRRR
jgi:hypothetical protein